MRTHFVNILLVFSSFAFFDIFSMGSEIRSVSSSLQYEVLMEMNVKIPMRDGIRLATDIYRPDAKEKFPVILVRTPYGSETSWFSEQGKYFATRGYVFAVQDCRGKYDSEGEWYGKRSETNDGYDTINWLATQNWSSGKVGMVGASYLGLVQWQVAFTENPYLKALVPIVAPVTLGRESGGGCIGGAQSPMGLSWLVSTDGRVNQNVNAYDWNKIFWHLPLIELPKLLGRNIPFWEKSLNLKNGFWEEYLQSAAEEKWTEKVEQKENYKTLYEKVQVPILQISGWFDSSTESCFYNYQQIKKYSKSLVAKKQRILVGPWCHFYTWSQNYTKSSKLGDLDFGPNSTLDIESLILRWFDRWLKEIPNGVEDEAPLKFFVMGKNEWQEASDWPLQETKYISYYLHSYGHANSLLGDGTANSEPPENEAPDKFIYDPANPTPALTSGENLALASSGPEDNRFLEERNDVLVYTSSILKEDIEITGPISVVLYVSSSAPETEFIVRLLDVHPNGCSYPIYVTFAGAFNTRCLKPIDQGPNKEKILKCEFVLPPTSNVFFKGHRIRVDICSAAFPLHRNLNTGGNFALDTKCNIAHQMVYHDKWHPSHVVLPVIPRND
ncbi:MAG: CocE/NonD family hydrolase [Thermodesulfobacteriota bacterium]